jgi:hypothetical protein
VFKLNGPQGTVPLDVEVEMGTPRLFVYGTDFKADVIASSIVLVNGGKSKLNWAINAADFPRWFRLVWPQESGYMRGTIGGGRVLSIPARADRTVQLPAWYTYTVAVDTYPWPTIMETSYGMVTMAVPPPKLVTTSTTLDYGASLTELSFTFWSDTLCDIIWSLDAPDPLATGITVNQINDQGVSDVILFTSNGGPGSEEARTIDYLHDLTYHGWQYKTFTFVLNRGLIDVGNYDVTVKLTTTAGDVDIHLVYAQSYPPQYPK